MPTLLDPATRARLRGASPTCPADVRADAAAPRGFWRLEASRRLGRGADAFQRARDELLSWRMHEHAGFVVRTSGPEIAVGLDLTLSRRFGPLAVLAPSRVVRLVSGDDRAGFVYATLPGHPVSGEEEFLLVLQPDEQVVATVKAVSRPASLLARLGAPVTRREQRLIAERYLDSLRAAG